MSRLKKMIWIVCLLGFVTGILFADFLADTYVLKTEMFSPFNLKQFLKIKKLDAFLGIKICLLRTFPFFVMIAMRHTKWLKCVVMAFLIWVGFSNGLLISIELINLGTFGILLYIAGVFPQVIFYIVAFAIFIWNEFGCESEKWNLKTTLSIVSSLIVGVCLEFLLNPLFIKLAIRIGL